MQSKQFAVAGIVTGGVVAGLGVVVLLAGLAGAERSDRDPAVGYEDVGKIYPDVDPLPSSPAAKPTESPSEDSRARPGGGSVPDHDGERYASGEPSPSAADDRGGRGGPGVVREGAEPAEPGGAEPTSAPTRTAEPGPTAGATESSAPIPEPTPTESTAPSSQP